MKTVFVCSVSPVLSQGLRVVLGNDFSVQGLFESVAALEDRLTTERPDLLVAEMSPAITLETLKHLRAIAGNSQIVLWFDFITPEFVSACLSLGIRGVISKSASTEAHLRCLTEVASGRLWIDKALSHSLITMRVLTGLKNLSVNSGAGSARARMPGRPAIPLEFPETIQMRSVAGSNQCVMPKRVLQMPSPVGSVIAPGPLRPIYAARR
jgi:hypothetical protein